MRFFFEKLIGPYILSHNYKTICEIGSKTGENTDKLLRLPDFELTIIDPCIDTDLVSKYKNNANIKIYKGLSLEMLPNVSERFDCILIDGDHNWYTVYNELKLIRERNLLKDGGTILLHDVGWPYGRRDLYYLPETVPVEFRLPYAQKGMIRGQVKLIENGGTSPELYNAILEGGPKNGVLTAVENFLAEYKNDYFFSKSSSQFGLGFVMKKGGKNTFATFIKWKFRIKYFDAYTFSRTKVKRIFRGIKVV